MTPKKQLKKKRSWKATADLLLENLTGQLQDEETPPKRKNDLAQLLVTCCNHDEALIKRMRGLVPGVRLRYKDPAKRGRPAGSCEVDDAEVYNDLERLTSQSSQMYLPTGMPVRTLQCSKTRAARSIGKLSRSQFCKRSRRCRLGISPGSVQRGRCDACSCWKAGGRKQVVNCLTEGRRQLQKYVPSYFTKWDGENMLDDAYELEACDSVEHLESLLQLLHNREHMIEEREKLSLEDQHLLEGAETQLASILEGHMEDIRIFFSPCIEVDPGSRLAAVLGRTSGGYELHALGPHGAAKMKHKKS